MGLDMYLSIEKYIPKYDWIKTRETDNLVENPDFKIISELVAPDLIDKTDSAAGIEMKIPVGYWRKANAIHKFFVDECANGVDECQPINLTVEQLIVLLDKCKTVLENPSLANEVLPTQDGFFFGTTEYDEWYINDLNKTVDIIDKVLAGINNDVMLNVTYQASW
jgi:hypothetical protein